VRQETYFEVGSERAANYIVSQFLRLTNTSATGRL